MNLEQLFFTQNDLSRWSAHTVLVAVSGGADSTAMLRLFESQWRKRFPGARWFVAHANHQLRGEESDDDEDFVRNLCKTYEIPLISERLEIVRTSAGLENDARAARYGFLNRAANAVGARYLATAHNRNDQVETVLYRILRGTGLAGLAGIAPVRAVSPSLTLVRPLLGATRNMILEYLSEIHQDFRTDSSNADTHFTRNAIRGAMLPYLRENSQFPVDDNLVRLSNLAREASAFIESEAEKLFRSAFLRKTTVPRFEICLNSVPLLREDVSEFLLREMFRSIWRTHSFHQQAMTEAHWHQLVVLLRSENGTQVFPGTVFVEKNGNVLRIFLEISERNS